MNQRIPFEIRTSHDIFRPKSALTHYHPAMPFGNPKKDILEDLFSSVLSQFKKYLQSRNIKFNNLGIFKA